MQGHRRHRLASRTKALAAIALLVAIGAVAASGCGESSGLPAAASHVTKTTSTGGEAAGRSSTTTATTTTLPRSQNQVSATSGGGSANSGSHHAKVHMVLPGPNSQPAPKLTPAERANVPVSDIALSSPAIAQAHVASAPTLSRRYTCQGANQSPPLHWTGIPSDARELALLVVSATPVNGKLFYDWAVAGLSPTLKGLSSGALPAGAVTGRNGNGQTAYSICPTGAKHESYVFLLYALPQSLSPQPGFDPATLRQQAMRIARHTGLLIGTYG